MENKRKAAPAQPAGAGDGDDRASKRRKGPAVSVHQPYFCPSAWSCRRFWVLPALPRATGISEPCRAAQTDGRRQDAFRRPPSWMPVPRISQSTRPLLHPRLFLNPGGRRPGRLRPRIERVRRSSSPPRHFNGLDTLDHSLTNPIDALPLKPSFLQQGNSEYDLFQGESPESTTHYGQQFLFQIRRTSDKT